MRKRGKVALGVLAVVLAVPLVAIVFLYASVSGGWDDAFRPKKSASSREVKEAGREARPVLDREASTLALPRDEPREQCHDGQHNWKVDDDYDVSCQLVLKAEERTGTRAEQTAWLRGLHDRLAAGGWRADLAGTRLDERSTDGRSDTTAYYSRGADWQLFLRWSAAAVHVELRYRYYEG